MRILLFILLLSLLSSCSTSEALAQSKAHKLPHLTVQTASSHSGFTTLEYIASQHAYRVLDGRTHNYLADERSIRRMRDGEAGGILANPEHLAWLGDSLFGSSAYNRINQFDVQSGTITASYSLGEFKFAGTGSHPLLFSNGNALLLVARQKLFTLDSSLNLLDEVLLQDRYSSSKLWAQKGSRLYTLTMDNPNTYSRCAGPCNLPITLQQTSIDFSDPKAILVKTRERELSEPLNFVKGSYHENQGWLLEIHDFQSRSSRFEYHDTENAEQLTSDSRIPEGNSIVALNEVEPSWFIQKTKRGKYELGKITVAESALQVERTHLSWVKGSFSKVALLVDELRHLLFIGVNNQLGIYDTTKKTPELILQQDFVIQSQGGPSITFRSLNLSGVTIQPSAADPKRLETALKQSYRGKDEHLVISSEVEKLSAADEWAIPLFVELIESGQKNYHGALNYSLRVFKKFGPKASEALLPLLKKNLGSSYSPELRKRAFQIIKVIDPHGERTIPLIQANLEDPFKVRSTVELLEFIGSPETRALADKTRRRWKF